MQAQAEKVLKGGMDFQAESEGASLFQSTMDRQGMADKQKFKLHNKVIPKAEALEEKTSENTKEIIRHTLILIADT